MDINKPWSKRQKAQLFLSLEREKNYSSLLELREKDIVLNYMTRDQRKKMVIDSFRRMDNFVLPKGMFCGGRQVPEYFPDEEKKEIMYEYNMRNTNGL